MTAIELEEKRDPDLHDALSLIKTRWAALIFGPFVIIMAFLLILVTVSWVITFSSKLSLIGALLTVPVFLLVLIGFAFALNIYLFCTIVGNDEIDMIPATKRLFAVVEKHPYQLLTNLTDLGGVISIALVSGVIVFGAINLTLLLTGGWGDLGAFFSSSFLGNTNTGFFTSSIRLSSLGIVGFAWIAFLLNVVTVTYTINYRNLPA